MLFAIFHCCNRECGERIWVPSHKLGTRGRCPLCGEPMSTPAFVPEEDLVEGPHIMQDFHETEPVMAGARA